MTKIQIAMLVHILLQQSLHFARPPRFHSFLSPSSSLTFLQWAIACHRCLPDRGGKNTLPLYDLERRISSFLAQRVSFRKEHKMPVLRDGTQPAAKVPILAIYVAQCRGETMDRDSSAQAASTPFLLFVFPSTREPDFLATDKL
jgi:hypothetical protein